MTFPNTHSALQAEKQLQQTGEVPFVIIPVPRIISSGCGLAVKFVAANYDKTIEVIEKAGILIEGVYQINKTVNSVERVI